jgi:FkbM family methyltransferase
LTPMAIPRIFHHIWLGSDEIPDEVRRLRQTWMNRHPTWTFRLWRDADLDWLRNHQLLLRSPSLAQRSDIARYEIIHRFGGVYLDGDMEALRPIDPLLEGFEFIAGREGSGAVCNALVGACAGHPLLKAIIDALPASCIANQRRGIPFQSGPGFLTRIIDGGGWASRAGVRIFPPAFFYPYDWDEPWLRTERFVTAYAVHHWHRAWWEEPPVAATPSDIVRGGVGAAKHIPREIAAYGLWTFRRTALSPAKRAVKKLLKRAFPAPELPHAVPWGPREILIGAPLRTRLLCPTDDLSLAPELALRGTYDDPFVRFLIRVLRPGMTFVDVGANVGFFTVIAAQLVGRGGRVFAYECNPDLVPLLRRNVRMNWFEDRVVIVPRAAHRDEYVRTLAVPTDQTGLGSLTRFADRDANGPAVRRYEVACERLDVGLSGAGYVDLMKIDVEGGEAAALDGASRLIDQGRVGLLSIEYRDDVLPDDARPEMEKRLADLSLRYDASFHIPGDPRPIPLDEVLTVMHYPQLLVRFPRASIGPG